MKNKEEELRSSKQRTEIFKKGDTNNTSLNSNSDLNNTVYSSNINVSNNDEDMPKKNINLAPSSMIINTSNNINYNINITNNVPFNQNINNQDIQMEHQLQNILNQNNKNILSMFSIQNIKIALQEQNKTIYLQKQLRSVGKEIIDYIITQLQGNFREVMKNKNGNYFCSDLFKECDQEQINKILQELSPSLAEDCLNNYSSHAIQTLIDRASRESEYRLILTSFNDYNKLLYVCLHPCGAYTIQKIIERIPDKYREEFNFIFSSFISFISKKKYGIVTVKKFISGTRSDLVTEQVMKFVEGNFMSLAEDQYANYLIQFLLEKWNNTSEGNEIKKLVRANFLKLCEKKYSSFICELYIKIISPEEQKELLDLLYDANKKGNNNNHHIMKILINLNKINNNLNSNNQVSKNGNNNKNNYDSYMPNNNINYNNQNNMNSRYFGMNNNSNGNNNINNFNIPFNNNGAYGGF